MEFEIKDKTGREIHLTKERQKHIQKHPYEEYDKEVREKAKKFKLKPIDFHNLYDLFWMVNSPGSDVADTLKLNKMDKWFHNFTARVERILFDEDLALDFKD